MQYWKQLTGIGLDLLGWLPQTLDTPAQSYPLAEVR